MGIDDGKPTKHYGIRAGSPVRFQRPGERVIDHEEQPMPLKYDPDTGIPSYVPDLGEELEEGVTPKPKVIHSKADVFRGDKPLSEAEYNRLRDGVEMIGTDEADKLLADALKSAKPAKLDKDVATDEEVSHLERLASEHEVQNWPMLLRLINRLRRAES